MSEVADVRLVDVTKRFDDVTAVDRLSLEIEHGSFFALLGPSGCGKTTTLRMIGGFEQPTEGQIYLGNTEVSGLPSYKRDVNTVFQSYALFPQANASPASSRVDSSSGSRSHERWSTSRRCSSWTSPSARSTSSSESRCNWS